MAGADAVFKAALGRTRSGSSFRSTTGRRSATVKDGSGSLVNSNGVNMHLATTGPGSSTPIGNATAEKRTYRPFAPKK
jgi:hypothetical protein